MINQQQLSDTQLRRQLTEKIAKFSGWKNVKFIEGLCGYRGTPPDNWPYYIPLIGHDESNHDCWIPGFASDSKAISAAIMLMPVGLRKLYLDYLEVHCCTPEMDEVESKFAMCESPPLLKALALVAAYEERTNS